LTDEQRGSLTVDHDLQSGAIFIEFERLESDDTILLNYRVTLSTDHVLAWIESILSSFGRTCRRMDNDKTKKRFNALLNLTTKESDVVYLSSCGARIILVRDGRVLKVLFALEPMSSFLAKMRETTDDDTNTAACFAAYVQGLMCPFDAHRNVI
jgi:hypothetical protein